MPECKDCGIRADTFCTDGNWRCGEHARKFFGGLKDG